MAVIVEDGTGFPVADSYVTRAEYIAHAAKLGVTVADDEAADVELIKAAEFIGSHEARLKGVRSSRAQAMAFPREGVYLDGFEWDRDEIPRNVLLCQLAVAMEIRAGLDPYNPALTDLQRKSVRVEGAIEVEYFGDDRAAKMSRASTARALLASLLQSSGLQIVAVRA